MNLPSTELLEQTHRFPGDYTFKVIGESSPVFLNNVLEAVASIIPHAPKHSSRYAKGGRHVSITLEARVASATQVRAIYLSLSRVPGLVMLL